MITLFRAFIIAAVCLYSLALCGFIVGTFMTWGYDKPTAEKISQDPDWYYATKIGSLRFLRIQEFDSLSKKNTLNSYISITDLKPVSSENNRYFVLNKKGEKNWVDYDPYHDQVRLPVNASIYSLAKTIAFTILGISIAIAIWTGIVLSRFALTAQKEHFFTSSNMRKLHRLGWVILIWGLITYWIGWNMPLLVELFLGYGGTKHQIPYLLSEFPVSILVGLLLLITSKAFEKGLVMREEQRLTV